MATPPPTPPPTPPETPNFGQTSPPQPPAKNNTTLIILAAVALLGCAGFAIVAAILFPVFAQARLAATRTQALSEMKQLGVAMTIYTVDYDDRFPPDMASAEEVLPLLRPYSPNALDGLKKMEIEELPRPNPELSGQRAVEIPVPSQKWMFVLQSPKLQGRVVVVYADGSTKTISEEDWPNVQNQ